MPKPAKVHWLGAAEEKVRPDLRALFTRELAGLFGGADVRRVTVHDCLAGYNPDQERKVILAVEVQFRDSYHMHIVKLGTAAEVSGDSAGWRRCAGKRLVGSPIFVNVTGKPLPQRRAAAVYEDAYTFFGPDATKDRPEFLEHVAHWAVTDDKPNLASVERVLAQIFGDLQRWFYCGGRSEVGAARAFYDRRLADALESWAPAKRGETQEADWRFTLRQDAIWVFCGRDAPDSDRAATYLDPYDFIRWAFANKKIPETLVGRSHGDLQGRNILVGVRRGEAEFPVVIDYGEMSDANVLAWDFVKLETELKTRLMPLLFDDADARSAVLSGKNGPSGSRKSILDQLGAADNDTADESLLPGVLKSFLRKLLAQEQREALAARARRAERLAFLFEIEMLLAQADKRIVGQKDAEKRTPPGTDALFPKNAKIDKLLRLLLRIRQEAALVLGFTPTGRHALWRDEYYFALAVYGLTTAKWPNYEMYWSEVALVSAGVAVAQMDAARAADTAPLSRGGGVSFPSYRVPLQRAHKRWIARDTSAALRGLRGACQSFAQAVPLQQEWGLLLAEQGELDQARELLQPLAHLCVIFGDYETLSRIGRVLKNYGDREWNNHPCQFADLLGRPPSQYYQEAYCLYAAAFWISGNYFPGVNAVTLALLSGNVHDAKTLAERVLAVCRDEQLSAAGTALYWVFASEGEAALVSAAFSQNPRQQVDLAKGFYEAALRQVGPDEIGMVQSTWDQLCRLWKALGEKIVEPIVRVFMKHPALWKKLNAGPLGDCGCRRR